ncbi:MAG TPA: hypothetical protein VL172_23225 [Kofleriaceae bacterium]|nr:hypothetical protein [Kofleriaceae bacterium]
MRRATLGLGLLLCGCTDSAVHVDFDIPDDYRGDVDAVSLAVLVPAPAQPFDCEQLAFGEVDGDTVALATVQQSTTPIDEGGAPLAGIPRTGAKLFYARGLDAQDLPLVAGCSELDDVDGTAEVTIIGEPTAVLTLPAKDPGDPLPGEVTATVVDARGQPLIDAEVRFTVLGPAAEDSDGAAATDDRGRAVLAPQPPTLPGPQALDVRVRWNRVTTDSLLGFGAPPTWFATPIPGDSDDLASADATYAVGAIGPAGEPGFAALGRVASGGGKQVLLAWYDGADFVTVTSPTINGALAIGLVRGAADSRDRVVTLTATQWIEIDPAGTLDTHVSPDIGRPATRIVPAGNCTGQPLDTILVSFSDDTLELFDAGRNVVSDATFTDLPSGARIAGSGCVSATGDADLHRTIAYSSGTAKLEIRTDLDGGRSGQLAALAQGVGFAPPLGGEAHLLASEVEVDGVRLSRWRLVPLGGDQLELEKVTDDGSVAPPLSTRGGDIDGDGQVDVVALLNFGDRDAATLFRVRVTLAVPHQGGRLSGLSQSEALSKPRLLLHDFDGDAIDDVLIAAPDQATILKMGP